MDTSQILPAMPGQLIARGTARLLAGHGYVTVEEFVPVRGLRVDLIALGPKSEIWIVECKSSRTDFLSDQKWPNYLAWCDRFFWAVDPSFPADLLPVDTGLILADAYGGEIVRMCEKRKIAAVRRKAIVQGFARTAAQRLHRLRDPQAGGI